MPLKQLLGSCVTYLLMAAVGFHPHGNRIPRHDNCLLAVYHVECTVAAICMVLLLANCAVMLALQAAAERAVCKDEGPPGLQRPRLPCLQQVCAPARQLPSSTTGCATSKAHAAVRCALPGSCNPLHGGVTQHRPLMGSWTYGTNLQSVALLPPEAQS
jgi:hypothetical protein